MAVGVQGIPTATNAQSPMGHGRSRGYTNVRRSSPSTGRYPGVWLRLLVLPWSQLRAVTLECATTGECMGILTDALFLARCSFTVDLAQGFRIHEPFHAARYASSPSPDPVYYMSSRSQTCAFSPLAPMSPTSICANSSNFVCIPSASLSSLDVTLGITTYRSTGFGWGEILRQFACMVFHSISRLHSLRRWKTGRMPLAHTSSRTYTPSSSVSLA
ncbi:hypothetical protein C8R45DRAFT_1011983 [Mycena sanguinolenta]|nr:hypothetical protein C8R45DRAFT_1011983 [Mycena sanguinolenta]